MACRPSLTCCLLGVVALCGVTSHPLWQVSAVRQERRVLVSPRGLSDVEIGIKRPTQLAILLILRQKCYEWRKRGLVNLPSYCYVVNSGRSIPAPQLDRYYDIYARQVPLSERRQDFQNAQHQLAQGGPISVRETPAI